MDCVLKMSNTLEKLSHQYHMQEIYSRASVLYKEMLEDSSLDGEFCSCANDIVNTGILAEMADIAKTLKYRARNARKRSGNGHFNWCYGNGYRNKYRTRNAANEMQCNDNDSSPAAQSPAAQPASLSRGKRSTEEEIARLQGEYLNSTNQDTALALLRVEGWWPNTVTGPKEWVPYSAMLYASVPTDQEINDFATFLYCKLNQPEAFPSDLF